MGEGWGRGRERVVEVGCRGVGRELPSCSFVFDISCFLYHCYFFWGEGSRALYRFRLLVHALSYFRYVWVALSCFPLSLTLVRYSPLLLSTLPYCFPSSWTPDLVSSYFVLLTQLSLSLCLRAYFSLYVDIRQKISVRMYFKNGCLRRSEYLPSMTV